MRKSWCKFILLFSWQAVAAQEAIPELSHHYWEAQSKAQHLLLRRLHAAEAQVSYGYDATFYHLQLKIDPSARAIEGQLMMEAKSTTAGLASVPLDLYANMNVVEVGEGAASYARNGNVLTLTLKRAYQPGEKFRVSVRYFGNPQDGGFGAFTFSTHEGAPIIASLSEPYFARLWWPCKDSPTDKADSVQVDLTVPDNLIAVSNGILESVQSAGGWKTFSWKTRYPITTYLVSVAVSNYVEFGETFAFADGTMMPLVHYVYPERLAEAQAQLDDTRDMLAFFNRAFGDYPFKKEKYGHAQFAWGGGMEHQTITSICGAGACFNDALISHELAHQWFGDLITMKSWQDIWLNEGFASYSEALYIEDRDGKAAYRDYMASMDYAYNGSVFVHDTTSVGSIFSSTVYDKGAWVLHMLRYVIGDSTFYRLLRSYVADPRYRFGNATTDDFKNLAEQISGQELDWFFEQWVYREGRPELLYAWKQVGGELVLRLQQEQSGASYRVPLELAAVTESDTTRFSFELTEGFQEFRFNVAGAIKRVLIDPDYWALKTLQQTDFDRLGVGAAPGPQTFALEPIYPNPFAIGKNPVQLSFSLRRNGEVNLTVFNALGQEVVTLLATRLSAGSHALNWDGRTADGKAVPPGIYFIRLQTETSQAMRKLVVLR